MKEGGGLRLLEQQQTILPRYDLMVMLGMGGRVAKPGYTTAESLHVNSTENWNQMMLASYRQGEKRRVSS